MLELKKPAKEPALNSNPVPRLAASLDGYVKVRLIHRTDHPYHARSFILKRLCDASPPYLEEVSVILPQGKVFPLLEVFIPSFRCLQKSGVIPESGELVDFRIVEEDESTLAYIL